MISLHFCSVDRLIPMTERDFLSGAGVLLVGPVSVHALVKVGAQSLSCPVLPGGASQTVVTANRVAWCHHDAYNLMHAHHHHPGQRYCRTT